MSEKEYNELNSYLNEIFIYLDKNYKYIIDNMEQIFVINDKFLKEINEYDLNVEIKKNNLSYEEIYDLAREIIESINSNYLELFDKLIETGILDFSYNNKYFDSNFHHKKDINLININRRFNYDDVRVLVHEFFHYTNCDKGKNYNNEFFTEFISIYFEIYTINYLLNKDISKEEMGYLDRLNWTYNRAHEIYYAETPLLAYNKFGNLNDDSIDLLNQYYTSELSKEQFYNECKYLLMNLKKVKENYDKNHSFDKNRNELQEILADPIVSHFHYFFGTMWAFYAIKNCDMNDILYVNNHMYDDNFKIEDCFKKMKIEEKNNETYKKSFESIVEYIEKSNTKRK